MKNAMKKIMSMVLVAMILVSALPFAASASEYALSIDVNNEQKVLTSGTSASYEDCLAAAGVDTTAVTVTKALYQYTTEEGVTNVDFGPGMVINMIADTRVYIWTAPVEETQPEETKPEENKPNFGWPTFPNPGQKPDYNWPGFPKPENKPETNKPEVEGSNNSGYYKLSGDVVLEICIDQNQQPAKAISIKDGIAADGRVNLNEVKSVVKYYYNAVDADTGIVYDGLYKGQTYSDNVIEWVKDTKFETVSGLYEAANNCKVVTIRVYISNAKLSTTTSSSNKADSSNPKTGDMIMAPVAIMTVSASLLAVAFYMNKKRAF